MFEKGGHIVISGRQIPVNNKVQVYKPIVVLQPFITSEFVLVRRVPLAFTNFIVPRL